MTMLVTVTKRIFPADQATKIQDSESQYVSECPSQGWETPISVVRAIRVTVVVFVCLIAIPVGKLVTY